MGTRKSSGLMWVCGFLCLSGTGYAQAPHSEDENLSTIRKQPTIGDADQRLIKDWVQAQVDKLKADVKKDPNAALPAFRERFLTQIKNPGNTPAFSSQLASKTAEIALAQLGNAEPATARALARVLVDMGRLETVSALLAGLKSKDAAARYLSVRGLSALKNDIAADKDALDRVVAGLREAGLAEADAVVLSQVYTALAYPAPLLGTVFDSYLAILEARLVVRRGPAVKVDAAEIDAYEFFRTPAVFAAMSADQKSRLVSVLAPLLRMDAQRYNTAKLTLDEIEFIERRLDGAEDILAEVAGKVGDIRGQLNAGGHSQRGQVLEQAYLWVGNVEKNSAGALNAPPWNVPIGAP